MCRVSFFFILFLVVNLKLLAQDKIYLKNGDILDVETVGRSDSDIEYEIPGSGGQTKYLRLGRIEKIIYRTGVEEIVNFEVTERIGKNSLWIVPLTSAYFNLNNSSSNNPHYNRFEILGFFASIEIPTAENQVLEITPIGSFGRARRSLNGSIWDHTFSGFREWYTEISYKFYFFPFNAHTAKTQNMYVAPVIGKKWINLLNFGENRLFGLKSGVNFIFTPEFGIRVEGKVIQLRTYGPVDNVRFSLSVGPVLKF